MQSHKIFAKFLSHAAKIIADEWNIEKHFIDVEHFIEWNNEHNYTQVMDLIDSF